MHQARRSFTDCLSGAQLVRVPEILDHERDCLFLGLSASFFGHIRQKHTIWAVCFDGDLHGKLDRRKQDPVNLWRQMPSFFPFSHGVVFRVLWRCCLTRRAPTDQDQGQWAWREWYKHRALCAGPVGHKEGNWVVYRRVQIASFKPQKSNNYTTRNKKPKGMNGMYIYIPASTGAGGGEVLPSYSTAAAPASNANDIKPADTNVAGDGCHGRTPLFNRANVVANGSVGFGPPLAVTVGLDGKGLTVALPELPMENFCELAYMRPWVLFNNRKK